jgi:hypothetical protein
MGRVGGKRTLVLVDSLDIKETHSEFFGSLSGQTTDPNHREKMVARPICGCVCSVYIQASFLVMSSFFTSGRGHQLTFQLANSPDVVIFKYGEYLYDNLLLLCPGTDDFATLDIPGIVTFVEKVSSLSTVYHCLYSIKSS